MRIDKASIFLENGMKKLLDTGEFLFYLSELQIEKIGLLRKVETKLYASSRIKYIF